MKGLIHYATSLLLTVLLAGSIYAQRYDNVYFASDADLIMVQGNTSIEHTLRGATMILPNGSNQLALTMNIPYGALANRPIDIGEFLSPGYQFKLKINIDPVQIQDVLTSAKTFLTQGILTLNSITKPVKVSYVPIVSRTDENGNFNIYMNIQFSAADFNLTTPLSNKQVTIIINDAAVNRV